MTSRPAKTCNARQYQQVIPQGSTTYRHAFFYSYYHIGSTRLLTPTPSRGTAPVADKQQSRLRYPYDHLSGPVALFGATSCPLSLSSTISTLLLLCRHHGSSMNHLRSGSTRTEHRQSTYQDKRPASSTSNRLSLPEAQGRLLHQDCPTYQCDDKVVSARARVGEESGFSR